MCQCVFKIFFVVDCDFLKFIIYFCITKHFFQHSIISIIYFFIVCHYFVPLIRYYYCYSNITHLKYHHWYNSLICFAGLLLTLFVCFLLLLYFVKVSLYYFFFFFVLDPPVLQGSYQSDISKNSIYGSDLIFSVKKYDN